MPHPNATVAGGSTGLGVLIAWLLSRYHVTDSPEVGAVIAGGIATFVLFLGRNGVCGLLNLVLHGSTARKPKPKRKKPAGK